MQEFWYEQALNSEDFHQRGSIYVSIMKENIEIIYVMHHQQFIHNIKFTCIYIHINDELIPSGSSFEAAIMSQMCDLKIIEILLL